jgi:UDP-N-acetyl-D-glucosamine/UDP-N-acetyl-D-galactosamine dehydrogenase
LYGRARRADHRRPRLAPTLREMLRGRAMPDSPRIVVVGLGYVGLPLAVALAKSFPVTGFDISAARVEELRGGHDRTGEVADEALRAAALAFTARADELAGADVFIVAVPTPVDARNRPDLGAVRAACEMVGGALRRGAIVCFESTVYPGVTEEICGPALEQASGLKCGHDFFLGYSPERINPGDRQHTVDRIVKVVAGQTPDVERTLAAIYGAVTSAGVFMARNIKTAEAAKAIENAQRDINIAFINEVAIIAQRLGLSVYDILDAAGTKWNFLPFSPGLVGGHCIGVDPYYLAECAKRLGHDPQIILSGRRLNDSMASFFAGRIHDQMDHRGRVLILGLTFKENVPDLRNTKVVDMAAALRALGHEVDVHDPIADPREAEEEYGIAPAGPLGSLSGYDGLVGAVPHDEYRRLGAADFRRLLRDGGLVADLKAMWRAAELPPGLRRWQL